MMSVTILHGGSQGGRKTIKNKTPQNLKQMLSNPAVL